MMYRSVSTIILALALALIHCSVCFQVTQRPPSVRKSSSLLHAEILSLPVEALAEVMQGSGKAKIIWNLLRQGVDPLQNEEDEENDKEEQERLSGRAKQLLLSHLNGDALLPTEIVTQSYSDCGTRKFLQRLGDGLEIESVLIPSVKFDRTTLCVSTQVGCDRGCAFCLTATMGIVRNLTSAEILSQVIRGIQLAKTHNMPALTNIVFMGMGDAGRNVVEVDKAVRCLTDSLRLSFAQAKVTVSTVGPSPEIFMAIGAMPCSIAWSLHSADPIIRKQLVTSSKHTPEELRDGLIKALLNRPTIRARTIMIALTLIEGVNDSDRDASLVADFIAPILKIAPKIAIDLIPYNDVNVRDFRKPSKERVDAFQQVLRNRGYFCSVRVTRGDAESAACGMLATSSTKRSVSQAKRIENMKKDIIL